MHIKKACLCSWQHIQVSDLEGKELRQTFKDYQLQFVGRELDDIEHLTTTSRSNVRKATKEKQARNRFDREGLSRANILRRGREIESIMKPKKRKKKKPVETFEIKKLV